MWFWFALGSAIFAALTSILAKIGIEGVNSNLATAIRTMVVVVMAWGIAMGSGHPVKTTSGVICTKSTSGVVCTLLPVKGAIT